MALESELSLFNPDPSQNAFIQGRLPWMIIISYLMFVKVVGPRVMSDRKPMDLKLTILVYNAIMVVANIGLCYECTKCLLILWPYHCNFKESPAFTNRQVFYFVIWYFLLIKYVELLDTVFFILRKKFGQVSFLHVFHHSLMCLLGTMALKYDYYSYYQSIVGSVNSGIHVLLYSYYAVSAVRPDVMRKYEWCKKGLTTLQIVQFFVYLTYMLYSNFVGCGFDINKSFDSVAFLFAAAITALFLNFYYRTYK